MTHYAMVTSLKAHELLDRLLDGIIAVNEAKARMDELEAQLKTANLGARVDKIEAARASVSPKNSRASNQTGTTISEDASALITFIVVYVMPMSWKAKLIDMNIG